MAEPNAELPTKDELAKLPPRAIVAYAARCARRVQPLFAAAIPGFPNLREHCEAIDNAIALAEQWANAKSISVSALSTACATATAAATSVAPSTGTDAATAAAKAAANAAATAREAEEDSAFVDRRPTVASAAAATANFAVTAAGFVNDDIAVITAAKSDFEILKIRDFKREEACDATERGLCSTLWKGEPPHWYVDGLVWLRELGLPKKTARSRRSATTKSSPPADDPERKQLIAEREKLLAELEIVEQRHDFIAAQLKDERTRSTEQEQNAVRRVRQNLLEQEELQGRTAKLLELEQESSNLQQEKAELEGKLSLIAMEREDRKVQLATLIAECDHLREKLATVEVQSQKNAVLLAHAEAQWNKFEQQAGHQEQQRQAESAAHQETKRALLELQQESLKLQQEKVDLEGKLSLIEVERDSLKVQPLSWYTKLFFRPQNIFRLLTLLVLGVMVLFALLSISEVYERQALDRWVKTKADEQRDRLANGAVGNLANSATPQRRQEYDTIRSRLLVLSFAGATTPSETVGGIRDVLLQDVILQTVPTNDDGTEAATKPASGKATDSSWWHWLCHWLSYQSSDLLLSLVILFSGTVGAVVTTLRKDQPLTLRDLGQGLAAGFITFLVIRGGKSIFLLDADPLLLINPYNSAFMGLLAGMFTELAYELLTSVAQEIANRLKGAFDPNNGNSNRSHSSPAKPPSEPPKPASQQNPTRDETTPTTAAAEASQPG